jgi:hypothetical protein
MLTYCANYPKSSKEMIWHVRRYSIEKCVRGKFNNLKTDIVARVDFVKIKMPKLRN